MEFIATFGYDHRHPDTGEKLGDRFVRVPADDQDHAREMMLERFGTGWAFLYPSEKGAGVKRFGLIEAPLGGEPIRLYEHSSYGGDWHEIHPEPRSPIRSLMAGMAAGDIYDDGIGNLYRWSDR